MGNFEKLSVLVIVVIIVMILVVAIYQWTENPEGAGSAGTATAKVEEPAMPPPSPGRTEIPPLPLAPPALKTSLPGAAMAEGSGGTADANHSLNSIRDILEAPPAPTPTPGPAPAPEPPKPAEPKIHVVEPGQTMGSIAKQYYPGQAQKGLAAIQSANPGVDPSRMRVGTKLTIPDLGAPTPNTPAPAASNTVPTPKPAAASIERGGWYVTKRGDTLTSISKRAYGTTERWPEIWIENMEALGTDIERPEAGIRIRIPR